MGQFGYTVIGAIEDLKPVGALNAVRVNIPAGEHVTEIPIHCRMPIAGLAKAVIYGSNGSPANILAESSQVPVAANYSWVPFPISFDANGSDVWLAWFANGIINTMYDGDSSNNHNPSSPHQALQAGVTFPTAPNPFGTPTWYSNGQFSIYAVTVSQEPVTLPFIDNFTVDRGIYVGVGSWTLG